MLSELNKDLAMAAIDIAELEARGQLLQAQLAQVRDKKLLELADRYEREVALKLPVLRDSLQAAQRRLQEAEQQLHAYQPPTVTVLGAGPAR